MGVFFGVPISGLRIERPLLVTSDDGPLWLTGGSYGSEGGAAATVVLIAGIIVIWRARWSARLPRNERHIIRSRAE